MDFLKENRLFVASSLATFCFGIYLVKDCVSKIREVYKTEDFDEAELKEGVKKMMDSPNKFHKLDETTGEAHQFKTLPLYKICLTGGPCGGKTTALAQITERLTERGYKVFVVPETPTMTMEGGGMIIMANLTPEKITKFQVFIGFCVSCNFLINYRLN